MSEVSHFTVFLETSHRPLPRTESGPSRRQSIEHLTEETRQARREFARWLQEQDSSATILPDDSPQCITPVFVVQSSPAVYKLLESPQTRPKVVASVSPVTRGCRLL